MKNKVLKSIVFMSVMYVSLGLAANPLFDQNTVPQSFHNVGQAAASTGSGSGQQMTAVGQNQRNVQTKPESQTPTETSAINANNSRQAIDSPIKVVDSGSNVFLQPKFDAQQKFQQLSLQEQQFEKLAANKISDLYAQNNMLTQQVSQMQAQLSQMGNALNQLAQRTQTMGPHTGFIAVKLQGIENTLGVSGSIIMLIGIILLVLLLSTWPLWRAKKMIISASANNKSDAMKKKQEENITNKESEQAGPNGKNGKNGGNDQTEEKSEYDFMSTQEGMNAKLDLARAYIAMDDKTSAENTLRDVLSSGDQEQQRQAQQLMSSLG